MEDRLVYLEKRRAEKAAEGTIEGGCAVAQEMCSERIAPLCEKVQDQLRTQDWGPSQLG